MSGMEQFQHLKIQLAATKLATNNFSDDNCIGLGGFEKVYKGEIIHSRGETTVALKRLDRAFGQGDCEFWKEIMALSFYKHKNIISLLGYCDVDGEKILVYEYASKKSLDSYLSIDSLTWVQRLKICVGAAHGLAYLHTPGETKLRMLHRNIKSSNILLDNNWNAKISDFGLSKFAPANKQFTFMVSNPIGTYGYIDPLYHETGLLTKESDIYSFGVVLFEVLCGRLCYGKKLRPLAGLAQEYYQQNKISELIYNNIKDEINMSSLKLFADIAYQCLKRRREERPLMTQIVSALERALVVQEMAGDYGAGILSVKILGDPFVDHHFSKTWKNNTWNDYFVLYIDRYAPLQYRITTRKYNNWAIAAWVEEFSLYVKNFHVQELFILVINTESVTQHNCMGEATMNLSDLTPEVPMTCKLVVKDNTYQQIGYLKVEVLYKPVNINITNVYSSVLKAPVGTPKGGGLLVIIIQGANLDDESRHAHTSVSLLFRGEIRKTHSMMNTNKPKWLKEFTFLLEQPPTNENLHLEVINDSSMGLLLGKGSLGCVDISLASEVNMKLTNELHQVKQGNKLSNNYLQVELHWRTSD
ncbi:receptor-like protein kinase HERK 1 [Bidens hawaiensis]|uniref:receptor-like protein kinase HERK 1 n=1 Tax=Bidens hawaiensis TaxID=980011 RepID=UPI004049E952